MTGLSSETVPFPGRSVRAGENPFLTLVMRAIRAHTPPLMKRSGWYTLPIRYAGSPLDLPFLYVPSRGCAFDYAGACTMCNFGRGRSLNDAETLAVVDAFARRFKSSPAVFVTTAGSFFDDSELRSDLRIAILERLRAFGFQTICTECRPEYLTLSRLRAARQSLGDDVELEVGIGLESSDSWIRRNCVNKMLPKGAYEDAVKRCHETGTKVYTHVLLKPAFLSEAEAIADAVRTLRWADEQGSDRFGLAIMNLKSGTLLHWCAQRGLYSLPRYWSVAAVLAAVEPRISQRVGIFGFESTTPYEEASGNCPACTERIRGLLQEFSHTRDRNRLEEIERHPCGCRASWRAILEAPASILPERVAAAYRRIADSLWGEEWWCRNGTAVIEDLGAAPAPAVASL